MKKLLILLPLLSMSAYAQFGTATPNQAVSSGLGSKITQMHDFKPLDSQAVNEVISREKLIGRKLISACNQLEVNETCEAQLYKLFKLESGSKIRIIKSGAPVTMDYSPNRLNVELDKQDKITKISIG
jgi:Peptidase inhibitor I78 family